MLPSINTSGFLCKSQKTNQQEHKNRFKFQGDVLSVHQSLNKWNEAISNLFVSNYHKTMIAIWLM